jgi:uncharacterized protein YqeY
MSLKLQISEALKNAMKEKNTTKLSILRVLKSEIERNEQTSNGKVDLSDGDIVKLIKKMVEGIKETTNNKVELAVLEDYLPKQLTEANIRNLIAEIKTMGKTEIGDIMKFFKTNYDGKYDGKLVSQLAKEEFA